MGYNSLSDIFISQKCKDLKVNGLRNFKALNFLQDTHNIGSSSLPPLYRGSEYKMRPATDQAEPMGTFHGAVLTLR